MLARQKTSKSQRMLKEYKATVIEQFGASAFDLLTPHEVATELRIESKYIPELIRQGWLAPVPEKDIGSAHQYYRWRVAFAKQYKTRYKKKNKIPS